MSISTILIIILSVLSVIGAFFIFSIQNDVKNNSEASDFRYRIIEVIETDIDKILDEDKQKQQMALSILQDLYYINEMVIKLKEYNTSQPNTVSQQEIDSYAQEFVSKIEILNNIIKRTHCYNWSVNNNATNMNNYTYYGLENFLIRNNYPSLKGELDSDIIIQINAVYLLEDPELLDLNLYNWEGEIFYDLSIILELGQYTAMHVEGSNLNLSDPMKNNYYSLLSDAYYYELYSKTYQQSVNIMSNAVVLMAIGAVVIGFVVSITPKKYIYASLMIGAILSIIGIWFFGLGFYYLFKANLFVYWW
ncbi:MAG: hypothetical protein GF329_22625 [Candidatus Lokiarchaeota archaeon]|nr:hypothetical protein [Candidatus Lokiarchaeota archaeon]